MMSRDILHVFSLFCVFLLTFFAWFYLDQKLVVHQDEIVNGIAKADFDSAVTLKEVQATFNQVSRFLVDLAYEKGGVYAYTVMKVAPLPPGVDMHLLGHNVGDVLYEQEGIAGMALCTHDFRNACSHTMVIGTLIEFGAGAFDDIRKACYAAPGGKGAYTMCFHGLGHGVFAFNGYDMEKTIAMCDELGTDAYSQREAIECFGGAVMEVIGGGGHDRELWIQKRDEYLQPDDPFGLCELPYMTDKYSPMCYNYMTPYAYEALGADPFNPSEDALTEVFDLCAKIPETQLRDRKSCYGGQGKEFIGMATGRDFSSNTSPSMEHLQKMYDWCALAKEKDGLQYCVNSVVDSLYWGGENTYDGPLNFCSLVDREDTQDGCYKDVVINVENYIDDQQYHQNFCADMPARYQEECSVILNI